ncbi:hypothetical protein QYS62_011657 [Fusarium acuminatum]|uniref:Uncharacterized protein n=1 Tax=Fusarium acuminatum TaxID=5515 RepID=A0ABZ2XBK6_9HYPO
MLRGVSAQDRITKTGTKTSTDVALPIIPSPKGETTEIKLTPFSAEKPSQVLEPTTNIVPPAGTTESANPAAKTSSQPEQLPDAATTNNNIPINPTTSPVEIPNTATQPIEPPTQSTKAAPVNQTTTELSGTPSKDTLDTTSHATENQPPTTSEDIPEGPKTTTQLAPIVQDTTTEQPLIQDTTTDIPLAVDTTTGLALVIDTTTQPIIQDTTTGQPLVQDTTTELPPPVVDTTTGLPAVDTTTRPIDHTPGIETTSQEVTVQDTTTELPLNTTTQQPPVQDTTSQEPIQDTTTEKPIVQDITTGIPPAETTTEQQQQPVNTTTAEAPVQDTTAAAEQPAETTTQPEPKPTTDKSKPTSKKEEEPIITQAPDATTAAPEVATASMSSVSSQIAALIPVINKWKDNPESLKEETNKEVEDTHNDIIAVIVLLGGKPDVGSLACMAKDLKEVSGGIIAGNVPAVTGAVSGVQGKNDELTDEKNEEEEEKSEEKSEEESTKQEETTKEKSTDAPTTTEAPTSTEESTTTEATTTTTGLMLPCASDTCGSGDSYPMGASPGKEEIQNSVEDVDCKDIPTSTIDGPLPTEQGDFSDNPFTAPTARPESAALPSKRDLPLIARKFNDDISPNPFYVASLTPFWGSAGVNGIYGYTAIIIVSDLGVYLSHIWENPVFIDTDWNNKPDNKFNAKAFEALHDSTADGSALSVTGLIGTDKALGMLHSIYSPKVFILTPFTGNHREIFGITTTYRYEEHINALASNLTGIIPGSGDTTVLGYTRTNKLTSTEQYGSWGRAIVEFDILEEVIISVEDATAINKGLAIGRWRLWVEDQLVTSHKFYVLPPAGVPADSPAAGVQKRTEKSAVHSCLRLLLRPTQLSAAETTETSVAPTTDTNAEETTTENPKTEETTTTGKTTSKETTAKETSAKTSATTVKETTTRVTTTQPSTDIT